MGWGLRNSLPAQPRFWGANTVCGPPQHAVHKVCGLGPRTGLVCNPFGQSCSKQRSFFFCLRNRKTESLSLLLWKQRWFRITFQHSETPTLNVHLKKTQRKQPLCWKTSLCPRKKGNLRAFDCSAWGPGQCSSVKKLKVVWGDVNCFHRAASSSVLRLGLLLLAFVDLELNWKPPSETFFIRKILNCHGTACASIDKGGFLV